MSLPIKTLSLVFSMTVFSLSFSALAAPAPPEMLVQKMTQKVEQKMPLVILVHADWCPACTAIAPALDKVQQRYKNKARFVVLDVTNPSTIKATQAKVKALGLESFYKTHGASTGTVAVLHPDSRKPLKVFKAERREAKYNQAIDKVLKAL